MQHTRHEIVQGVRKCSDVIRRGLDRSRLRCIQPRTKRRHLVLQRGRLALERGQGRNVAFRPSDATE